MSCHLSKFKIYNSDSRKIFKMWHKPKILDSPGQNRHLIIVTEKGETAEQYEEEAQENF